MTVPPGPPRSRRTPTRPPRPAGPPPSTGPGGTVLDPASAGSAATSAANPAADPGEAPGRGLLGIVIAMIVLDAPLALLPYLLVHVAALPVPMLPVQVVGVLLALVLPVLAIVRGTAASRGSAKPASTGAMLVVVAALLALPGQIGVPALAQLLTTGVAAIAAVVMHTLPTVLGLIGAVIARRPSTPGPA